MPLMKRMFKTAISEHITRNWVEQFWILLITCTCSVLSSAILFFVVSWKLTDISGEHVANFRVEEEAKLETTLTVWHSPDDKALYISQKTKFFITTTVGTPNLTPVYVNLNFVLSKSYFFLETELSYITSCLIAWIWFITYKFWCNTNVDTSFFLPFLTLSSLTTYLVR